MANVNVTVPESKEAAKGRGKLQRKRLYQSPMSVQVSRDKLQFNLNQLRAGKTFQELDDDDITAVCAHS
jgi:hypothetical protein